MGLWGVGMSSFFHFYDTSLDYIFNHLFDAVVTWYLFSYIRVIVHEYGHYLFVKQYCFHPKTFSIGSGPFYSFKTSSGMLFRFGFVPTTGYVQYVFSPKLTYYKHFMIYFSGFLFESIAYAYIYFQFLYPFWGFSFDNAPLLKFLIFLSIVSFFSFNPNSDFVTILRLFFRREFIAENKRYRFKNKGFNFAVFFSFSLFSLTLLSLFYLLNFIIG